MISASGLDAEERCGDQAYLPEYRRYSGHVRLAAGWHPELDPPRGLGGGSLYSSTV